jgi:ethanolamine-phosphate cytidylyltransferase
MLCLGRALGTYLIVGVNSDDTIIACKGPPVCGERERVATVKGKMNDDNG